MAEILADAVRHAVARRAGHTLEGHRQSAAGQRPGPDSAKSFYYDTDCTVYHDGIPEVIPALTLARLWPGSGTTFDVTRFRYISFTIVGTRAHYIATQANWVALTASVDAIGIEYHTRAGWRPYQPLAGNIMPPPPPIIIITSTDGGEHFTIMSGSNPYVIHGKFSQGTRVLSFWWTGFNGGGSYSPQIQGGSPGRGPGFDMEYNGQPEVYPYTTDWHCVEFGAIAARGDNWPLPWPQIDSRDSQDYGVTTRLLDPYYVWPKWKDPVFGLTAQPFGYTPAFDPTNNWVSSPPDPAAALGNGDFDGTFGVNGPVFIEERIYIRGNIPLPSIDAGATVTAIDAFVVADTYMFNDDTYVNQSSAGIYSGGALHSLGLGPHAGSTPGGEFSAHSLLYSLSWWNFGADNLVSMKFAGWYWNANYTPRGGTTHTTASAYVDFAFTVDNHTSYASPEDHWYDTNPGGFDEATTTDPGPYGSIATEAIELGNVGPQGRAYFRHEFRIPSATLHSATLQIIAETGIGAIYVNGHVIALPVGVTETTDLWDAGRVLTLTIPISDLVADGVYVNTFAVQAYSASGPCRLVYKLTIS